MVCFIGCIKCRFDMISLNSPKSVPPLYCSDFSNLRLGEAFSHFDAPGVKINMYVFQIQTNMSVAWGEHHSSKMPPSSFLGPLFRRQTLMIYCQKNQNLWNIQQYDQNHHQNYHPCTWLAATVATQSRAKQAGPNISVKDFMFGNVYGRESIWQCCPTIILSPYDLNQHNPEWTKQRWSMLKEVTKDCKYIGFCAGKKIQVIVAESSLLIKMTSKLKVAQTRPSKLCKYLILSFWTFFRGILW